MVRYKIAEVVKLADTLGLGPNEETLVGSNPTLGTNEKKIKLPLSFGK